MRFLLLISIILISCQAYAAEFLVKAREQVRTQAEVEALKPEELKAWEARSRIGDIIVVRPDGWEWGKCECLPGFVVIKAPEISIDDAKKYEEPVYAWDMNMAGEETAEMVRVRRYSFHKATILQAVKVKANVGHATVKVFADTIEDNQ